MLELDDYTLKKLQDTFFEMYKDIYSVCEKNDINVFILFGTAIGAIRHNDFIPWDDDFDIGMKRSDYYKFKEIIDREYKDKYTITDTNIEPRQANTVIYFMKNNTKFISKDIFDNGFEPGIEIDIFPYDNVCPRKFRRNIQYIKTYILGRLIYLCGENEYRIPMTGIKKIIVAILCKLIRKFFHVLRIKPDSIYKLYLKEATRYNNIKTKSMTSFAQALSKPNELLVEEIDNYEEVNFRDIKVRIPKGTDRMLRGIHGNYMEIPPLEKRVNHRPRIIEF